MTDLYLNKTNTYTSVEENHVIFTRYLYDKYSVSCSFILSLLDNQIDQSLFWGYELYYSGFTSETMDMVMYIYEVFYKKHNPAFTKFIREKMNEWKLDNSKHCLLATIIRNMLNLQSYYSNENLEQSMVVKKPIKIIYLDKDIAKYKTKEYYDDNMRPNWRFLSKVCMYPIYNIEHHPYSDLFDTNSNKKISEKIIGIKPTNKWVLLQLWLYHWEYYSAKSPIWKNRIEDNGGILNHETKQIHFNSDEVLEKYYEKYGYEPDEQSNETERMCIGVCTNDFIQTSV
jgi:hypothetical protein